MLKALITGARGFCARHLAERLRQESPIHLVGLARGPLSGSNPFDELHDLDLRNRAGVSRAIATVDPAWVFHLAGLSTGAASDLFETNMLGTVHLLEALREHSPGARVLLVGSAAEYGPDARLPVVEDSCCNPRGAYGISKHAATLIGVDHARRFGMHIVVARPFNIVGAGMPASLVLGAVLRRVTHASKEQGRTVVRVGNIDTARDFVAVEDVVDAYVKLVQGAGPGEIFNLCSGESKRVRDLIREMLAHAPGDVCLEIDPGLIRSDDPPSFYGSADKARRAFGFSPRVPIEESLRRAWIHELNASLDETAHERSGATWATPT